MFTTSERINEGASPEAATPKGGLWSTWASSNDFETVESVTTHSDAPQVARVIAICRMMERRMPISALPRSASWISDPEAFDELARRWSTTRSNTLKRYAEDIFSRALDDRNASAASAVARLLELPREPAVCQQMKLRAAKTGLLQNGDRKALAKRTNSPALRSVLNSELVAA